MQAIEPHVAGFLLIVAIIGGLWTLSLIANAVERVTKSVREARRERRPCRLCATLPNTNLHACSVAASVKATRHEVSYYYRSRINPRARKTELRYHDVLIGPHGRPVLTCKIWHQSKYEAELHGGKVLRLTQAGKHPSESTIIRRNIEGSDKTVRPRRTVRNARPLGWSDTAWLRLQADWKWSCAYCGQLCSAPEIEHRIPLARGGADAMTNIAPACKPCNREKRTMTDSEYVRWRTERGLPTRMNGPAGT